MRKKRSSDPANHERWLVSYADFITLLFAFFVIMYAMSRADIEKLKRVQQSLQRSFGDAPPLAPKELATETTAPSEPGGAVNKTETENKLLKEKIDSAIAAELGATAEEERPDVVSDSRGLVIRFAIKDLYAPGKASIAEDFHPLLLKIAKIVATSTDRVVRVEGHSDPNESSTERPSLGWELSAARAAWVGRFWAEQKSFPEERLIVSGVSHFHPLRREKNKWAQAANRRLEVVVIDSH